MRVFVCLLFFMSITSFAYADVALVEAAQDGLNVSVRYNGAYVRLDYPGGDVPPDTGGARM